MNSPLPLAWYILPYRARHISALKETDRAHFLPDPHAEIASNADGSLYAARPLPLGHGATISAPMMHAVALQVCHWLALSANRSSSYLTSAGCAQALFETLETPRAGIRCLDIGCGSGFVAAAIASIVRQQGVVVGVDRIAPIVGLAEACAARSNLTAGMLHV